MDNKQLASNLDDNNLKKTTLKTPSTFKCFAHDVDELLLMTEKTIIKYLENNIYTNKIPESIQQDITLIFETTRKQIETDYFQ
jgi:hypothetical protein